MEYSVSKTNLHIVDSWSIPKMRMYAVLREIREDCRRKKFDTDVFRRSLFSLKMEWICHNFLYFASIKPEQTKDTDLDNPCDRPEWQYIICGILVWLFVW